MVCPEEQPLTLLYTTLDHFRRGTSLNSYTYQWQMVYLVNKPFPAASISEDNALGWEIVRKINICPRKQSLIPGQMWNAEDNLSANGIIIRYTSKPERVFFFYNPWINFLHVKHAGGERKTKTRGERACAWRKKAHRFVDLFLLKLDQGLTSHHRSKLESSAFSLYFTDSTVWNLLKTSFLMDK